MAEIRKPRKRTKWGIVSAKKYVGDGGKMHWTYDKVVAQNLARVLPSEVTE